jgi:hypothetical protein
VPRFSKKKTNCLNKNGFKNINLYSKNYQINRVHKLQRHLASAQSSKFAYFYPKSESLLYTLIFLLYNFFLDFDKYTVFYI